ncbi:MAG: FtsX-like permease family protein [Tetrasphaera sp.]
MTLGITTDIPVTPLLDGADPFPVALVGPDAARTLGIPEHGPYVGISIWLNSQRYSLVGQLAEASRAGLDGSVAVPLARAESLAPVTPVDTRVLVLTEVGAGAPVARVIRAAIRTEAPETLTVSAVSDFTRLRTGVSDQLARLSAGVGALLLVLAMLIIANSMVIPVVSRTSEIGLRRSLGASRAAVARIFLLEGALAGGIGGLAGAATGVVASLVVAITNAWSYRFPALLAALAPVVGVMVAVVASAYPAWRAASIQPAEALRSD